MSCDLLTKCRTCLCDSHKFHQIYDYVDDSYEILEMLDGIVPQIDIKTSSNYSSLVCQSCVEKLVAGYKFQQLCIETNKRFHDLMRLSLFDTVPKLGNILEPLTEASFKSKIDVEDDACLECEIKLEELEETSHNDDDVEPGHNTDNDTDSSNAKLSILKERKAHKSSSKSDEGERPSKNICRKGQFSCSESEKDVEMLKSLINETDLDMEEVSTHIVKEETKLTPQIFADRVDELGANAEYFNNDYDDSDDNSEKNAFTKAGEKHIKNTHRGKGRALCTECGKTFLNAYNLRLHKARHRDLRNYQCPECPLRFNRQQDQKDHTQTHTKVKPHESDICSSRFKNITSLRHHKTNIHSEERPFKCDQCGNNNTTKTMDTHNEILKALARLECKLNKIEERQTGLDDKIMKIQSTMKQLLRKNVPISAENLFPISTIDGLCNAEKTVASDIEKYGQLIKLIISPDGLFKNFNRIFTNNVIMALNYGGVNNKKSFKDYKSLNQAHFYATNIEGSTNEDFVKELRKCFRTYKSRAFKKEYDQKKKNFRTVKTLVKAFVSHCYYINMLLKQPQNQNIYFF